MAIWQESDSELGPCLFAEARAHRFADPTESNHWHRGRLKFPGRIEQAPEGLGS